MPPRHSETQATCENLFFTVTIIKLSMLGDYISIAGASTKAKTQVISICTLQIKKVLQFI